jgi:cobaltochelatase CobS
MKTMKEILAAVEKLLGGGDKVELDVNDKSVKDVVDELHRAKTRLELTQNGIAVDFPSGGSSTMRVYRIGVQAAPQAKAKSQEPEKQAATPVAAQVPKGRKGQHTYVPPAMAKDLMSVLVDEASHIPFLTGPTQCGKSTLVRYVAAAMGRKAFQINCRGDMGSELFFGEKTIVVDEQTKQNKIVYQKGIVEQAMTEGLDEAGNETGKPGVLFVDEVSACPAHVAHGLNRLFESDDPRRTMVLAEDGGRVVRSHSGFRIVLAGNTAGRGATDMSGQAYAAQHDALDISLLNRVAVFFKMGYDKGVEKRVLLEKVGDDKVVRVLLAYRDSIRQALREGKLSSPFSTAHLIHIADMYRVFGDLAKAIFYVVMEYVLPEERPYYNEQAVAILGTDILKRHEQAGVDYV